MGLQITNGQNPGRNESCPCGSRLKYKHCHGDESKRLIANRVANLKMMELVRLEQKKKGIVPWKYKCQNCGHGFDVPKQSALAMLDGNICPKCDSPNIKQNSGGENENNDETETN